MFLTGRCSAKSFSFFLVNLEWKLGQTWGQKLKQSRYTSLFQLICEKSERDGIHFRFISSSEVEFHFCEICSFLWRKNCFSNAMQLQILRFCDYHEAAKTSLKRFQMKSSVCMPNFLRAIDFQLQNREVLLPW